MSENYKFKKLIDLRFSWNISQREVAFCSIKFSFIGINGAKTFQIYDCPETYPKHSIFLILLFILYCEIQPYCYRQGQQCFKFTLFLKPIHEKPLFLIFKFPLLGKSDSIGSGKIKAIQMYDFL